MSDLKIQAGIEASTENIEAAFERVGDKAEQMAGRLQREGAKAGEAVDNIGNGAQKNVEKFSKAESQIAASIKRATTNLETLGKTASEKLQFQINQKGLDASKFEPMLAKLREVESANVRVGMSAAQTAAALRNVPAQFTDIAVSLASGQKPLTVLLQQGGQLKDMFGGVGAAARALGGYVASLVNPVTIAAAAIGGIGYAFYAARTEADEFRKNLILTGNISGLTTEKFNAMAQSMANVSGITRGAAAEALTAMAASGNIGADSIERLTKSALQFEKAGGPAVAETVKQFEALGKEPVKASVELSEKTHYLTLAVYQQIKSLEEQGKASEAAALAQKTWADAIDQRTPQMVENIGLLGRAWNAATFAASGFWDAMKGIGRDDSTVEQKITALKSKIEDASASIASGSINTNRLKQQKVQWAAELAELMKQTPEAVAERAKAKQLEEQKIKVNAAYDSLISSQRTKNQQWRDEQAKLDADMAKGLVNVATYLQSTAAIRAKYEEKGSSKPKVDKAENAYNSLLDSLNKQLGTAEKLNAVEKLNIELQEKKYAKISAAQKEGLLAVASEIDAQKKWQEYGRQTVSTIEEQAAAQKRAKQAIADELKKVTEEVENYGLTRAQIAEKTLASIDAQIAAERALNEEIGVGSSEPLKRLEEERAARVEILKQARQLEALDLDREASKKAAQAAEDALRAWEKTVESIDKTFHDAFADMIKDGKADWDAFGKALATSFKTAVADEIYKLTIKPIVVSVVSSFAGGAAQAAGAAAGQSGSGIGGVVQGVQAAYGAYNSGISNAATAFATSGVGQYMGLSTQSAAGAMGPPTAEGAYGYTAGGTALSSSGSSFVSSAGPYAAALAALIYGDNLMKAGWGLDNNRKGYAASAVGATAGGVIAGMAAGASSGASAGSTVGPWGTAIGAVVGAIAVPVLSRLFGHNRNTNADATGVQGTFDLSGFTGDQWQQFSKRGGTFRSDRRWTDTFGVTSDIDKALDSSFTQAVAKMQDMGKTLGVEAVKSIEGFQHTFSLQLSDNGDMSKAGEKLAAEITKAADEIAARMVPNIDEFKRLGETASETFERLNSEVEGTNAVLLAMGKDAAAAFGGVGLASIAARENLIDLAGGLDKLSQKTQSYYASFYDPGEQLQRAAEQAQTALNSGFADLNLAVPTSKKAFRDLVESQDLSSESGRRLFNALLDLSDEFDTVSKRSDFLANLTSSARTQQGSIFDTFASDAQKLESAKKIVNDTFASIGKAVPDSAEAFLSLAQSIDPATEAGQGLIAALAKVSNAFAYVQTSAAAATTAATAAAEAAAEAANRFFAGLDLSSGIGKYVDDGQAAIKLLFGSVEEGALTSAQAAAQAAADAANAWRSAAANIKTALANIKTGQLAGLSPEARYHTSRALFDSTSAAAKAGDATAAGNLGQVAQDFLEASRAYNASGKTYQDDREKTLAALGNALDYSSAAASAQDALAKAANSTVSELQKLNASLSGFAAQALALLNKNYSGTDVATATGAVNKLAQLQADVDKWFAGTSEGFSQSYAGGRLTRLAGTGAQFTDSAGNSSYVRAGDSVADIAGRSGALRDYWQGQFGLNLGGAGAVNTPSVDPAKLAQMQAAIDGWFASTHDGDSIAYGGGTLTRDGGEVATFVDAEGKSIYVRAQEGVLALAKRSAGIRAQLERDWQVKLPSYAVGSVNIPTDQVAQIHKGEMVIPASAAQQLRRFGIQPAADTGLQAEILAELKATRQAQQQSYAGMQQQLAIANTRLATMEKRLSAVEDQSRLALAGRVER